MIVGINLNYIVLVLMRKFGFILVGLVTSNISTYIYDFFLLFYGLQNLHFIIVLKILMSIRITAFKAQQNFDFYCWYLYLYVFYVSGIKLQFLLSKSALFYSFFYVIL